MALFQAGGFTGFSDYFAIPANSSDVIFTGSVDLVLPTGIAQQVFDTLSTALACIHFMEQRKLYSLSPQEDVTIVKLRSKLLTLGNTYINQKMINSRVRTYHGGQVQAIHRSMAGIVSLSDALAFVGFHCIGLPWGTDTNPKMETDRAAKDRSRIQVVDYVYRNPTLPRTNLQDSPPIVISSVYIFKKPN